MATASRIRATIQRHPNPRIQDAIDKVWQERGLVLDVWGKAKGLHKFGENLLVGTAQATVMTLPSGETAETHVTTNAINTLSSSSGSDDMPVTIEGHTVSGTGADAEFTFVTQTATLDGTDKVTLSTPLARVTRLTCDGTADNAGVIYVSEDDTHTTPGVPDTAAKIHLMVPVGENQSLKASTTISNTDYLLVEKVYASLTEKGSGYANIRFRVREVGSVFQTKFKRSVANGGDLDMDLPQLFEVPRNADVTITAEADNASTPVSAGFMGRLAAVVADAAND